MNRLSNEFQQVVERVRKQPPLIQVGLAVVVALILYLAWDRHIAPTARVWGARADTIEQQVRSVRDLDQLSREVRSLRDTIATIGPVFGEPQDIAEGELMLTAAVNEVRNSFNISNDSFDMRSRGTLPRGSLQGLSGGAQAVRLTGLLRFDSTPADAIAVIAALESRSEIARIESIEVQRIGGRRVSVRLNIEAWVIPGEAGRGRNV